MGIELYLPIATYVEEFRSLFFQCCHIALFMVGHPLSHRLIEFINSAYYTVPTSSVNILRTMGYRRILLHTTAKNSYAKPGTGSRSTDSHRRRPSQKSVNSIIGHFVDGSHNGENLAHHVVLVLRD
jgi:hypothetical protein